MKLVLPLLWFQTLYYLVTAIWPLVHIESFMEVTGPKTDVWLVRTVAMLLIAISVTFLSSLFSRKFSSQTFILAIACCGVLILIDVYYTLTGVISKIYLADAGVQLLILVAWIVILSQRRS